MSKSLYLNRRRFIIAGSAAVAAPFIVNLGGLVPAAKSAEKKTYVIGPKCIGCQVCRTMCPVSAINYGDNGNEIDQEKCLHCGTCYKNCPISVIDEK